MSPKLKAVVDFETPQISSIHLDHLERPMYRQFQFETN